MAEFVYRVWLVRFLSRGEFEYDWDDGNLQKNISKHGTTEFDASDAFEYGFVVPLGEQVNPRILYEKRFAILSENLRGKVIFVCFTLRKGKIRVISIRSASRNERKYYEQQKKICEKYR